MDPTRTARRSHLEPAPVPPSIAQPRAPWLFAAAALLAVLALGNLPLISGRAAPKWDAIDLFEPAFALAGDSIRAGQLVKWDPWSGGGAPAWTQPELGTTSPVLLAISSVFTNPEYGYIAYWMSVWAFGGLGMLLLAKHTGCSASAGAMVACGFVASGFFSGHAEHMSSLYSVSFLPWILWRFDAALKDRDWWSGVQAGVLYGLSALGGYPEFTILTPGFLFLWAIAAVLLWDSTRRIWAAGLAAWIATIVTGALIFSLPYAGLMLRTRGYTDYIGTRPRDVSLSSNLLPPGAISTLASPYLANLNLVPNPVWPESNIAMTSVYTGAATLVLALFALRRKRWRWGVAAIGAFFLCCAVGNHLPVRGWLYDLAPPTRYFRNPSLFRAYVIVVIGYLAALGARDLAAATASRADRVRLWRIAILAAGCAVVCFIAVSQIAGKSAPEFPAGVAHLCVVWLGFAALCFLFQSGVLTSQRFWGLAAALACLDAVGALYLARPTLWDSPQPAWFQKANAGHNRTLDLTAQGLDRHLLPAAALGPGINDRNVLIKQAVLSDYLSRLDLRNRFHGQMTDDPVLSRMATGSKRIWFSPSAAWEVPNDASFRLFQRRVFAAAGTPVLFLHSPAQMLALAPEEFPQLATEDPPDAGAAACMAAAVTDLVYQPNLLSFRYDAPSHGYLLVTDRWADGWEATVNGATRPVLGADFIYRGIEVDAGPNQVRFVYQPSGFLLLLAVSWGTLILAAAWQGRRLLRAYHHE